MPIRFSCPCSARLKTNDGTAGKRVKCPKCGRTLLVPDSAVYDTVAPEAGAADATRRRAQAKEGSSLHPPVEPHPSVGESKAAEAPAEPKARVVVADSIPSDLVMTCSLLREHNYQVFEAMDGVHALDLIRRQRPAAAVLNVKLDNMSGFQVVQQLRSTSNPLNQQVWDTPVMMTTERIQGRDKQYAMSLGVDGYFVKPVTPAQICGKLERAVNKYRPPAGG